MQTSSLAIPLAIPGLPEGKNAQPAPFGICLDPPLSPSSELPPTSPRASSLLRRWRRPNQQCRRLNQRRRRPIQRQWSSPSSQAAHPRLEGSAGTHLEGHRGGTPRRPTWSSAREQSVLFLFWNTGDETCHKGWRTLPALYWNMIWPIIRRHNEQSQAHPHNKYTRTYTRYEHTSENADGPTDDWSINSCATIHEHEG